MLKSGAEPADAATRCFVEDDVGVRSDDKGVMGDDEADERSGDVGDDVGDGYICGAAKYKSCDDPNRC